MMDILNENGLSADGMNIFQAMEMEALELAQLSRDRAFAIDELQLGVKYEDHVFFNLSDIFFSKMFNSPDDSVR
jgi:hypothetical protein